MSRVPAGLWQNLIAVQVYGANTGVGKTVFSTLLGSHFRRSKNTKWLLNYVKPVSTGSTDEADDRYVQKYAGVPVRTLFQFNEAVSPHVAARNAKNVPSDDGVIKQLYYILKGDSQTVSARKGQVGITIVETAGGVLSPGPSGTPQADLFRPMRLPVILVGDHRLGGISSTISAAESLLTRGYDIDAVICFDDKGVYGNSQYLQNHFKSMDVPAFELPWIPNLNGCSQEEESEKMMNYYETQSLKEHTNRVALRILSQHKKRLTNIMNMAGRTEKAIWHPFTQHKSVSSEKDILVFDSAYGDYFQTKHTGKPERTAIYGGNIPLLYPAFDGSASWWTQGLGHGNPRLSLAAAYAAGRYGHIMFAGATHEPAITLAEQLLKGMQNPRLTKCFYTDDGSTAVEVGIKMALRAACKRYDWDGSSESIAILGLKGSYHGDTIGAMDASEPCVYNKKVDWYRGRGYWFDFPTVKMKEGKWVVEPPEGMEEEFGPSQFYDTLDDVFDLKTRGHSPQYEEYITNVLNRLVQLEGKKFGALVMEPVILGAGGMIVADPLFQWTLVQTVRSYQFAQTANLEEDPNSWAGLPILFDEVFTGLYRLGRFSSASFLQTHPDISVHAKLLTGGLLPLSTTLASDSIFAAFLGDSKADALLHGHSYTAHPIGCHVANMSLQTMKKLSGSYEWQGFEKDWAISPNKSSSRDENEAKIQSTSRPIAQSVWSMWSKRAVSSLSHHAKVDHVIAIGSVLAVSLKDQAGSGYTSNAAAGLRDALLNDSNEKIAIHSRVLGNVIYFMASMTSKPAHLAMVEKALLKELDRVG